VTDSKPAHSHLIFALQLKTDTSLICMALY